MNHNNNLGLSPSPLILDVYHHAAKKGGLVFIH